MRGGHLLVLVIHNEEEIISPLKLLSMRSADYLKKHKVFMYGQTVLKSSKCIYSDLKVPQEESPPVLFHW